AHGGQVGKSRPGEAGRGDSAGVEGASLAVLLPVEVPVGPPVARLHPPAGAGHDHRVTPRVGELEEVLRVVPGHVDAAVGDALGSQFLAGADRGVEELAPVGGSHRVLDVHHVAVLTQLLAGVEDRLPELLHDHEGAAGGGELRAAEADRDRALHLPVHPDGQLQRTGVGRHDDLWTHRHVDVQVVAQVPAVAYRQAAGPRVVVDLGAGLPE